MLPFENGQVKEIWPAIREEYNQADRLLDVVVATMFDPNLKGTKYRGINDGVLALVFALLAKVCRTHRAVAHAGANGLGEDAMNLARSMYESTMIVLFILQKPSKQKQRAAMYHAWAVLQQVKMFDKWKQTPGLRRQATKKHYATAKKLLEFWTPKAGGTDVQRHWSGTRNLETAAKLLREDRSYQMIYRHLSMYGHAGDVAGSIEVAPDGKYVVNLVPNADHVNDALNLSRMILWILVARINKQWGFGLEDRLHPLRPPGVKAI